MKWNKRIRIIVIFLAAVTGLLWLGHEPQPTWEEWIAAPAGDLVVLEGQLHQVYSDNTTMTEGASYAFLVEDDGDLYQLRTGSHIPSWTQYQQRVEVAGFFVDADPTRSDDAPIFDVQGMRVLEQADMQAPVDGNERWVNVACRFGDMPDETPRPREFFEDIMKNSVPGMDHYWRQTSSDLVNIEGSAAYGWYNLPQSKDYYLRSASINVGIALQVLMRDCVTAARDADGVDFKQFAGINIMLNDTFGCCAWGGSMSLAIDGENVRFRTTWLPPWAFNSLHVIAHEMGHGWGLPHSGGSRSHPRYPYDSAWDIMSGGSMMVDQCRVGNNVFECFQVGTIGYHLAMLGWIPDSRIVTVARGESQVVTLDALSTVRAGIDDLVVKIPTAAAGQFYTVEARTFTGYDRNLPGEAIILHTVMPGRTEPAQVVDADNNGNVNDEGAMWLPGETFTDSQNKITVQVLSRLGTTFAVRVTNGR